jgi:hypothetical protein
VARYLDRTARRKITYAYAVRAINDAGPGPFSTAVKARRP